MSKHWLADSQLHYMVLGLDNKKGEHYFLCIDTGCYAHLIYFINLHVRVDQNGLITVIILQPVTW